MKPVLLTRDAFREAVFARDLHLCVWCGAPAQDAHHIMERRLFHDGGYYLDNGASLCPDCHILAERTTLSPEQLRTLIGARHMILPEHLYSDQRYDKWGNPILLNGRRLRGELFQDESVQKVLKAGDVLDWFTHYVKYPRTYHLPWSPSVGKDDRVARDLSYFYDREVVVTVKKDGENTTMYSDHIHARSLDSASHPSRTWVKNLHARIAHDIPPEWRVCGENLYAKHSIHYLDLRSYFEMFSVWDNKNICLSWDETVLWAGLLGLDPVDVLYRGKWDEKLIRGLYTSTHGDSECEGYVVRVADAFPYREFSRATAKYVRAGHVHTHGHWMRSLVVPNQLKGES
jgi:hypothetical protein